MSQIKAIIFDADDVLIIKPKRFSQCLEEDYGIKKSVTSDFFKKDFQNCLVGKSDLKKELEKHIKEWGWKGSVDELLAYWFKVENHINDRLVQFIEELKSMKIRCFMGTNNEIYRTKYLESEMFNSVFDKIFSSARLGCKKPETRFFEKVFAEISKNSKITKTEILFVDDDPENIDAAKSFGFQTFLYKAFPDFKQSVGIRKLYKQ